MKKKIYIYITADSTVIYIIYIYFTLELYCNLIPADQICHLSRNFRPYLEKITPTNTGTDKNE